MIKCMNPECGNYKHELDEHIEICPACGKETHKVEIKGGGLRRAAPAISLVSIGGIILTFFLFNFRVGFYIPFFLGTAIIVGCIILAVMSRVIGAIITTVLAAAAFIGIFAFYGLDIVGSIFG